MANPETHTCECGYTWRHGHSGSHSCGPHYQKTIADLRAALLAQQGEALDAARLDFIEASPDKQLRHHKRRWAFVGFTNYEFETFKTARAAYASLSPAEKQAADLQTAVTEQLLQDRKASRERRVVQTPIEEERRVRDRRCVNLG